jgi:hypothetical protein
LAPAGVLCEIVTEVRSIRHYRNPSTLDPSSCNRHANPENRHPGPYLKPLTHCTPHRTPEPQNLHHTPYEQTPKHDARNPKPRTLNPEALNPEALNPEP